MFELRYKLDKVLLTTYHNWIRIYGTATVGAQAIQNQNMEIKLVNSNSHFVLRIQITQDDYIFDVKFPENFNVWSFPLNNAALDTHWIFSICFESIEIDTIWMIRIWSFFPQLSNLKSFFLQKMFARFAK